MASKGRGGKIKGANFELKICRLLSKWWLPGTDITGRQAKDLPFRRSRGSGGWDHRLEPGDIVLIRENEFADAPEFPFSIEAKNREGWDFNTMVQSNKDWIGWKWWEQCMKAAEVKELIPWMIFTRNQQPDYVMLPLEDFAVLFNHKKTVILPKQRVVITTLGQALKTSSHKVRERLLANAA